MHFLSGKKLKLLKNGQFLVSIFVIKSCITSLIVKKKSKSLLTRLNKTLRTSETTVTSSSIKAGASTLEKNQISTLILEGRHKNLYDHFGDHFRTIGNIIIIP
jgi:hypothetical protein